MAEKLSRDRKDGIIFGAAFVAGSAWQALCRYVLGVDDVGALVLAVALAGLPEARHRWPR